MTTKFKRPFGEKVRVSIAFDPESMTKQSFAEECNINAIMARWQQTGVIEHVQTHGGVYGDFSDALDFHSALLAVGEARDSFMTLPSSVRKAFNNDPGHFLDFVQNPDNLDEARAMGLVPPASEASTNQAAEGSAESKPDA